MSKWWCPGLLSEGTITGISRGGQAGDEAVRVWRSYMHQREPDTKWKITQTISNRSVMHLAMPL